MPVDKGQIGNIFKSYITLTYGGTVDWTVRATSGTWGVNAVLTLTGDATLNEPTGMSGDEDMVFLLKQDATGGRTLTFPSTFQFIGNPDHTEQPSGFDLIHIKYESATGNFHCQYARPAMEKEQLIAPGGSNVNLDMSALTDKQVREYHGRTIYFNNLNSTGGGTLSTLVDLDQAWLGYKLKVIMRQSANGGALRLTAAKVADSLFITGIDDFPFLDTAATHFIELGDDHLYQLEFDLVVRDPSGTGATKFWSIQNVKYRFVGGVTGLTPAASVDWDLLTGTIKTLVPDQATTLTISNLDTQDSNLLTGAIHINMGGTAYDITLPANSKIADGNDYLTVGSPPTIENMVANEDYALTCVYDGTDFVWNMAKYV